MKSKTQMRAFNLRTARLAALAVLGVIGLSGCSGGGADTTTNPITDGPSAGPSYTGPVPATADIQAFRINFWENVRATDRCGTCHNAGGQAPQFARSDDVNAAYQQATGVVNRDTPSLSLIVTKVGGGHNCWLPDPGACASILTRWITDWVGATSTGGRQIQLVEPTLVDPGSSKRFPALPPADFKTVYDLLDANCSGCHQSDSATAQSPYFAAGGLPADTDGVDPTSAVYREAYNAAIPKINLDDPSLSRFVIRLGRESHNCWTVCSDDAKTLQDAIAVMAGKIEVNPSPPGVLSKALTIFDGTIASGGNRYESNVIALYEFKTGQGAVAFDTSGVSPSADLNLSGDVSWVGGYGINVRTGKAQASTTASRKFHQLITATGEYSIEAWVVPGNVTQEDARIVSYSGSTTARNFTMGQTLYNYDFFSRSTATGANGAPALTTDDDAERLQASLQHVVMTFDPINGRRIYVNGEFTGDMDGAGGGTLGDWDNSFAFVLGNEVSNNRQWQGVVRLVAVHNRALNLQQIQQNFAAGVGQKFFLLFGVSHIIDVPRSYILFETTQYDSFGYLFTNPKFISLDPAAMPGNIPLKGMRIGVNGAEAQVGQAYRLLDTAITNEQYSAATGQTLSTVGTIVPLEQGPTLDQFFLCFDQLGAQSNPCTPFTPGATPAPVYGPVVSDIGVKTFDAINATMASITGVSPNNAQVKATYSTVRQSLPAVHDIQGYLGSHQTSLAQLALQYCSVMMEDSAARSAFFGPGVNFASTLAPGAERDAFINVLFDKMIGGMDSQPTFAVVSGELNSLITKLCTASACGNQRTITVLKAACGATLGNAATLVQ
jgi:hypothetical protein